MVYETLYYKGEKAHIIKNNYSHNNLFMDTHKKCLRCDDKNHKIWEEVEVWEILCMNEAKVVISLK